MAVEKLELVHLAVDTVKESMKDHHLSVAVDTIRSNCQVRESQRVWPVDGMAVFTVGHEMVVGMGSPGDVRRAMKEIHSFQSPAMPDTFPGAIMPRISGPY